LGTQEDQKIPVDQRDFGDCLETVDDVSERNESATTRHDTGKIRGIRSRPVRTYPQGANSAETADNYAGIIAILNSYWRVVECRDRLQWILQRRGSPKTSRRDDWRGRSYCRTAEALRRHVREFTAPIDPAAAAILAALPVSIDAVVPAEGSAA
jgi:hypothetical protein